MKFSQVTKTPELAQELILLGTKSFLLMVILSIVNPVLQLVLSNNATPKDTTVLTVREFSINILLWSHHTSKDMEQVVTIIHST
jgi:hypothetical protein